MKLRCIIVDDEKGAHVILKNYIDRLDEVLFCGSFYDAVSAYRYLKDNIVDLVLLDINMPEMDGFGLLELLDKRPAVIITTAYSDHAFKSYDYNAIDYLHKPIRFERFLKAVEKTGQWLQAAPAVKPVSSLAFKVDGQMVQIQLSDLLYVESLKNYMMLHTRSKKHMVLMTMTEMERLLPSQEFIRVHKSYIVNTSCIERSSADDVVINGVTLPVGKTYKKYVASFLKDE